jgi:hypothetical protein
MAGAEDERDELDEILDSVALKVIPGGGWLAAD